MDRPGGGDLLEGSDPTPLDAKVRKYKRLHLCQPRLCRSAHLYLKPHALSGSNALRFLLGRDIQKIRLGMAGIDIACALGSRHLRPIPSNLTLPLNFPYAIMKTMLDSIKNKIETGLVKFAQDIDRTYSLTKISPILFSCIKDFILRDGKRIRPILFITGYLGFAKRPARGLYTSAIAIELLHDFMLVHDDIIDKSDMRRNRPSMHALMNGHLKKLKDIKFSGQDLAIVIGDVMYATAIHAFLSIHENMERKERALKKFIEAAIYTGGGEFIELLDGAKDIRYIKKETIYKIYDYKTAYYTFSCPLSTGAILAGAEKKEIDKLFEYGIYLGRIFQIKDDILGMFSEESKIGKSSLTDLKEAKKTLLIWFAYNNSSPKNKSMIRQILTKEKVARADLLQMRQLISDSGALDYAKKEISGITAKADALLSGSRMRPKYKKILTEYTKKILAI